jgi:membrane protein YdbS with pleckstrin-like domain
MRATAEERVCLEARRHSVVLARPLVRALVLAAAGGILLTQPLALVIPGALLVAVAALTLLRAVWRWERIRLVVTTDKLFVVNGSRRGRSTAVRLRALQTLEIEQSLPGRVLGYGTIVAGPLEFDHLPRAKRVYSLVEQLAG